MCLMKNICHYFTVVCTYCNLLLLAHQSSLQVVEAAARRALAAERAQQQALQMARQPTSKPAQDEAVPSTSGRPLHCISHTQHCA